MERKINSFLNLIYQQIKIQKTILCYNFKEFSMFTSKDLFTLPYFSILKWEDNSYEIQSNNTKHCWKIHVVNPRYHELLHKHHQRDRYHKQTSFCSLYEIVLDIIEHDEYQLRKKGIKIRKEDSYFEFFLKEYGE